MSHLICNPFCIKSDMHAEVLFSNSLNSGSVKGKRRFQKYEIYNILGTFSCLKLNFKQFFRQPVTMESQIWLLPLWDYIHPTVRGHLSYRAGYLTGEVDLWNCVVWQQTLRPIC